MKPFFLIISCCLAFTACKKEISTSASTSNLSQNCQAIFKRWDELIVKLESNSNVPAEYVQWEKEDRAIILNAVQKIEESKKEGMCEFSRRSIDRKLKALASDPHGLDEHIRNLQKQNHHDFN